MVYETKADCGTTPSRLSNAERKAFITLKIQTSTEVTRKNAHGNSVRRCSHVTLQKLMGMEGFAQEL